MVKQSENQSFQLEESTVVKIQIDGEVEVDETVPEGYKCNVTFNMYKINE